ncbi:MAG TPA: hypothetical protein VM369_11120, partial [Candidatus Binatia bacterium]|nr:hypothetical protein [Candidatus Binatia bacterium]
MPHQTGTAAPRRPGTHALAFSVFGLVLLLGFTNGHTADSHPLAMEAFTSKAAHEPKTSTSQTIQPGQTPEGMTPGDWSSIQGQIAQAQYHAAPLPSEPAVIAAGNARQQLTLRFDDKGAKVSPAGTGDWSLRVHTRSYGRAGHSRAVPRTAPQASANRIAYEHRELGLTEWYLNSSAGLEHGYTLNAAPTGTGPVQLEMNVQGLAARASDSEVTLTDGTRTVMHYAKLVVQDRAGKTLPATLETLDRKTLRIAFDDSGAQYPVTVDPLYTLDAQLIPTEDGLSIEAKQLGRSVALEGDTAVVGAPLALGTGASYVFTRSGAVWTLQQRLRAADAAASDQFGISVALSGDTALVGANTDDTASGTDAGSAYVFTRSGSVWSQQQQLLASDGLPNDGFGSSVALSGDTALVGAYLDDTAGGSNAGSATVFTRSGSVWSQQQQLLASGGLANDFFGISVALSGETALVGAYQDDLVSPTRLNAGSAYVFMRSAGVWTQQQQLIASGGLANDFFGYSVGLSGDTALVGAYADDTAGGTDAGSAYVFTRSGSVWSQQQQLLATGGLASDQFGFSVALSGETAVVGGYMDDNAAGAAAASA